MPFSGYFILYLLPRSHISGTASLVMFTISLGTLSNLSVVILIQSETTSPESPPRKKATTNCAEDGALSVVSIS